MSNFPCKIIEADLAADIVTLQMEGDYTVSAGQKYLCDAAPVSAEPVAEVVREALESAKNGLIWYRENFPEAESGADDETEALIEHALACLAAPVTAQPDVTQQTLDDVMAGIPARNAEIEALRKEIEALQAAPVKPYSLDLDPAGIRALTADAISGALALGFQGVSPPPNNEHWLAPFWEIGRESAVQAQQPVSGAGDAMERALAELVDKIVPGLDTGDLLADAATASKALDARPSGNPGELPVIELPTLTKPEAPANTVGLKWHAHTNVQMLSYGRTCAEAQRKADQAALAQQDADKTDSEIDRAFTAVRKKLVALPRYSFLEDGSGGVRCVKDTTGAWIPFDKAHALFDPVSVDAARKEQA